jgi:hypothetical protein
MEPPEGLSFHKELRDLKDRSHVIHPLLQLVKLQVGVVPEFIHSTCGGQPTIVGCRPISCSLRHKKGSSPKIDRVGWVIDMMKVGGNRSRSGISSRDIGKGNISIQHELDAEAGLDDGSCSPHSPLGSSEACNDRPVRVRSIKAGGIVVLDTGRKGDRVSDVRAILERVIEVIDMHPTH